MTILCTIDLLTREVFLPADQRIASYDHNADVIRFQAEPIEDFSLDTSSIKIAAQGPNKARHDYAVDPATVAIEEETGYITFDWPIPQGVTEMPENMFGYGSTGQLIFAVCAEIISGDTVSKAWHSDDGIITVVAHLEPESGGGEDPEEEATNAQKIAQLQTDVAVINTQVGALANGSPTPVETIAEMTDESAVYLYTGSETGYTAGNWYYYDGSAWTSGGTYGGAVTDTTLSISGAPADAKAVGDALSDITIEVDDTLSEQGKAADAKAVGDAIADKADTADVEAEINSLDDRVTALEGGGDDVYEDRGDVYTLFSSLEDVTMKKTDYRLTYNSSTQAVTEQSYTSGHPAIHYIPKSAIIGANYPRIWLHRVAGGLDWSVFADYDPTEGTYTALTTMPLGNTGKLVRFENIADGHYLAFSTPTASWTTGLYIYLARLYICPRYTPAHDGWDVDVCEDGKPITLELSPVDWSYPAFYIDMQKYGDCLVRLVNSGTGTTTWSFIAMTDYTSYASRISNNLGTYFSIGDFSAWYYDARYLTFFFRTRIDQVSIKLTMGYVPVENARKAKEEGRWGAQFAFHNVDTPNELIFACAVGSILDIDVCRTLDGYFVCIHSTTINGHTIASTNLEDLELTYNQMEVTKALKTMRKYGTTCYFNFRETTSAQIAALLERSYNYLGKMLAYDGDITASDSELAGHAGKYYGWASGATIAQMIAGGISPGKIYAPLSKLEDTPYNVGDIICVKSIASGETLSNFAWDGECAVLWVNNDTPGFVRG